MKHKGPGVIREPNLGALGRTRPRERGTVARLAAKRWKLEQGQVCKESPWAFCGLSIFSPVGVTVGFLWAVYNLPGWSPRGLSVGGLCSSWLESPWAFCRLSMFFPGADTRREEWSREGPLSLRV